jgi:heme exporter protein A
MWSIRGTAISQKFNRRVIFEDISFTVESGQSLLLTGPNGSGKTTLVRIICQLQKPHSGKLEILRGQDRKELQSLYHHFGLVGPYLQLYNNLTALENYQFFSRIRGLPLDETHFKQLMERFGLRGRELDELRTFSSGMLQRMKYVIALLHDPHILVLDEPTANLDEKGAAIVYQLMEEQKKQKILILATNEPREFQFGEEKISLSA